MKEVKQQPNALERIDSKDSIVTTASRKFAYKKYNKITSPLRSQFLQLIVNENCSIKKASKILNLNYSSAKSIIAEYRKESQRNYKDLNLPCGKVSLFRQISTQESIPQIIISTSIGSIFSSEQSNSNEFQWASKAPFSYMPSIGYEYLF